MTTHLTTATVALLMVAAGPPMLAQDKPTLTPDEYGRWETLGRAVFSPYGRWVAYGITSDVGEHTELRIRQVERDSARTIEWGESPVFAPTGSWLAYAIGVSQEERERLEEADEPVRLQMGLLDLRSGEEQRFEDVERFAFDDTGEYLALRGYAPEEPEGKGADVRIVNLQTFAEVTFGNVDEIVWNDRGSLIAMTVATGSDHGNGVQVYDAASGRLQSLHTSGSVYRRLAWRDDASDLAVLRSVADASEDENAHHLLAWRDLDGEVPVSMMLDPGGAGGADFLEVVRHRRPQWSPDGAKISFGLRPTEPSEDEDTGDAEEDSTAADDADEDVELSGVQIWHTSDVDIFPQQQVFSTAYSRRSLLAVWDTDRDRVVQIGSNLLEDAEVSEDWRHGVERAAQPYPWGMMFGRPYHDVWVVDLQSGERRKVLERVRYSWTSAGGGYLLTFDGEDYWSVPIEGGDRVNLTSSLPSAFADTAYDTPTDLLPPHGVGGWVEGDEAVLLYDEYDIWRVRPDGSAATRLTRGVEDSIIHRVEDLDEDREAYDPAAPIYLSLRGEWSEQRGYARLLPGGRLERLVLDDRRFSGLERADSAETFVYRAEARDDSPDLFVTGADLRSPRQVTDTNPFLSEYAWTRSELIQYRNEAGRPLQGVLLYPANHDPSRRYPMIVYAYEILSPQIHYWENPSERDYYNFTTWTQQGYFVLMPDIVFRARDPGVSVVETVGPAIRTVVDRGLVDGDRVGFIGHSWGGYESTYLATHTNLFAAAVAGAPLTDFVSFMGAIHWNPGVPEVDHWETGQARMEVPFWEDPEAHRRNSPIHRVHLMETPLLMAFGDDDGVVDWDQGTEFYNFARRAEKQMVLLVYEGEDHGFRTKENQIDYHRRILEWFGHYLKGDPAPAWITKGVRYQDLEEEKRRVSQRGAEKPEE